MGGMQELQYLVHLGRMYDQMIRWRPHPRFEVIGGMQSMVYEGSHVCVT